MNRTVTALAAVLAVVALVAATAPAHAQKPDRNRCLPSTETAADIRAAARRHRPDIEFRQDDPNRNRRDGGI